MKGKFDLFYTLYDRKVFLSLIKIICQTLFYNKYEIIKRLPNMLTDFCVAPTQSSPAIHALHLPHLCMSGILM